MQSKTSIKRSWWELQKKPQELFQKIKIGWGFPRLFGNIREEDHIDTVGDWKYLFTEAFKIFFQGFYLTLKKSCKMYLWISQYVNRSFPEQVHFLINILMGKNETCVMSERLCYKFLLYLSLIEQDCDSAIFVVPVQHLRK